MKSTYKHDCKRCTFLGTHEEIAGYLHADLYFCNQLHKLPTVIARYSDEGSDYTSGLGSRIPSLMHAEKLAKEKGLL